MMHHTYAISTPGKRNSKAPSSLGFPPVPRSTEAYPFQVLLHPLPLKHSHTAESCSMRGGKGQLRPWEARTSRAPLPNSGVLCMSCSGRSHFDTGSDLDEFGAWPAAPVHKMMVTLDSDHFAHR